MNQNKSASDTIPAFPYYIMQLIQAAQTDDFSGIGVIFYTSLNFLKLTDLGRSNRDFINLPIVGAKEISTELVRASRLSSPWHDGFHCVNIQKKNLHIYRNLFPHR